LQTTNKDTTADVIARAAPTFLYVTPSVAEAQSEQGHLFLGKPSPLNMTLATPTHLGAASGAASGAAPALQLQGHTAHLNVTAQCIHYSG
jgi:hypothetical protein